MATWVTCTRKADKRPIHINLDTVTWLRWNDEEEFTAISWATGDQNVVRIRERPEDILTLIAHEEIDELHTSAETIEE